MWKIIKSQKRREIFPPNGRTGLRADDGQKLERPVNLPSVLAFTLPSIVMMVVMSLYTIVDGVFVSRLVGTAAFSAVNMVYPLLSVVIGLGTMFGSGLTAVVSIKAGEGRQEEANRILSFVILFTILLSLALSALSLIFLRPLLYSLGSDDYLFRYCRDYAVPLILFFPAQILQLQFQSLYIADGKPHMGLILTIVGGLANIVLDYLFIAVFSMGIAGAAAATGIGYSIPAAYGLLYFGFHRKGLFHFVKPRADWRTLGRTMTNGASEMVGYLSTSVTTFLFNVIMMRLAGRDGVAAVAVLLYLDFVLVAVGMGYSMGLSPLISFNYGRGDKKKLRGLYRLSMMFCTASGLVMTVGTIAFSGQLSSVFAPEGSRVYELAASGLGIYAFSYLFKGLNLFSSAMFTALGNGKISGLLSLLRTLVFLVITLLSLSAVFGIDGVWYAVPLAELMAVAVSLACMLRFGRRYHYLTQ